MCSIATCTRIVEIDNVQMDENIFEVKKYMHEIFKGKTPEPSRREQLEAFRSSDPMKALQRLVQLRQQSGIDLDQSSSSFGKIYRTLLGALLDAAGVFEMCAEWLEGGGVLLAAEETGCELRRLSKTRQ